MRLFFLFLATGLLLSGCSSNDTPTSKESAVSLTVPDSCEIAEVVAAFDEQVEGSAYVPTDWQPAEGTDLEAALSAGGLACSYGIQVAEVGGTILWAPASDELWATRSADWIKFGQSAMDLEGFEEDAAFIKQDGTSADEMHVWTINLLIDGMWIQVSATFLQTVEEANPIIQAAIEAAKF